MFNPYKRSGGAFSMSYESGRSSGAMPLLIGVLVGNLVSGAIHAGLDNTDARIKGVQINNEQLYGELTQAHTVDGLILNDSDHTFAFHSRTQDGQPESCKGSYDVENNIARVSGTLACTQTVAVK
jgi:hypothetical protein